MLNFAKGKDKSPSTSAGKNSGWRHDAPSQRAQVRMAMGFPVVQPKLRVSRPGDPGEREADDVAERIVSAPAPAPFPAIAAAPRPASVAPQIQACCGEQGEEEIRRAAEEPEEEEAEPMISAFREGGENEAPESFQRSLSGLRAGGAPLAPAVRSDLESRFGHDFSSVRIHTGPDAARMSESINARAFTVGEHIAFSDGSYRPHSREGKRLLAHELTHVVQQRGARPTVPAQPVSRAAGTVVQRDEEEPGLWDSIVNWGADQVYGLVREYAPGLEPILREGPFEWIKGRLAAAFDGLAATVRGLLPAGAVEALDATFGPLLERAAAIVSALASGDCGPLLQAIDDVKNFITEVAGQAWDGLTEMLRPIGDFFSDLWSATGAPAIEWLTGFAGDVWDGITQLGRDIWDWTRPIRDGFSSAWSWIKETLFGPEGEDTGDSSGGIMGWVTTKAGEAWDWVKEQARPVWEPVSQAVETVTALIPPPFIRELGESFQGLGAQLDEAGSGIGTEGDEVAENREALAAALPTVQDVLAGARAGILGARTWILETVGNLSARFTGFLSGLRTSGLLAGLAGTLSWLEGIGTGLATWAQQKVAGLFDFVVQAFDAISPFVEKILGIVQQVISVVGDILQLPSVILGTLWNLIPECIRNPIKDFFLNQILARIPVFSMLLELPDIWARVEAVALRILRQVFVDGDLLGAAWTFFSNMLSLIGIPPELVVSILAKAATAIGDILTNPIGFLITMVTGVGNGFLQFFSNIGTHLLDGVTGWLFGALEGAGIRIPTDFSLGSILGFVMEVLGITLDNIFERLERRVGPEVVAGLRRMVEVATGVWEWVSVLITEGPGGLWRLVQERLSGLWDMVLQSAMGWIIQRVTVQASVWLASLLDISGITPAINTLIAIYRAIQSAVEYMVPILRIVEMGLDGIGAMARGDPAPAANFVEAALGRGLPVAIGFLATQLGLGGISSRIREIVDGARELVNQALDWLIDRAVTMGTALMDALRRGVDTVRGGIASLAEWWRGRSEFTAPDGEDHSLYFTGSGASARLMIASGDPKTYREFIDGVTVTPAQQADKQSAQDLADQIDAAVLAAGAAPAAPAPASAGAGSGTSRMSDARTPAAGDPAVQINGLLNQLGAVTARFMPSGPADSTPPVYGPTVNGFGSSASVLRLAPIHRVGSEPRVSIPVWAALNRRMVGSGNYYIRGHLLNDNLGGPGTTFDNMTPLTQSANGTMRSSFENPVKMAVNGSHGDYAVPTAAVAATRKTVNFVVTAHYGRSERTTTITKLRSSGNPDDAVIADVIEAEQYVPVSVTGSAHEVAAGGGAGPVVAQTTITNPIEEGLGTYSIGAAPRTVKYLNSMTRAQLLELNGIGDSLADAIIANRPFRTREEIREKTHIADGRWAQMQSTPGVYVRIYEIT